MTHAARATNIWRIWRTACRRALLRLILAGVTISTAAASPPAGIEVPIRIQAGHVYVDLQINGKGPFHFVFDSGALNVLSPDAAARLGLAGRGNVEAIGTGGSQRVSSTKVEAVQLGGLSLANQTFYVVALPPSASEDTQIDGLIGYEWLQRYLVRLDYAAPSLTFYTDRNARPFGAAASVPIRIRGRIAEVDGTVDGVAGRFSIDTGSSGSLTLNSPFVKQHDLAARYGAKTRVMSAIGVGGPVFALLARASVLQLGEVNVNGPVTYLSQQATGTSASKDLAGNIGFGVLRQFTIVFDYPHRKLYFERNRNWGEPDLADRSGLRIERATGGFIVTFVADNSPGMTAGLKVGDRIVAVDALPSETLTLTDVRTRFKGPVGLQIKLVLAARDDVVTIVLGDL